MYRQSIRLIFILAVLITGFIIGSYTQSRKINEASAAKEKGSLTQRLIDERVAGIYVWRLDNDKNLLCIFRAFDHDSHYEGHGVKLSVLNESGATIYEDYFSDVSRVHDSFALRDTGPQLVLWTNYGGNANFLEMLDYQDGKIVKLTDKIKNNNDFGSDAEVRPQFRTGVVPAQAPFQILLTNPGLPGPPEEKYTSVFRIKDGKYQHVGEFSQRKVDDYIERLMTENSRH